MYTESNDVTLISVASVIVIVADPDDVATIGGTLSAPFCGVIFCSTPEEMTPTCAEKDDVMFCVPYARCVFAFRSCHAQSARIGAGSGYG